MKVLQIGIVLVLVAVGFTVANTSRQPAAATAAAAAAAPLDESVPTPDVQQVVVRESRMAVAFRLDPEVTRGLYLGERWVSPPSFFFAQPGNRYIVRAKVQSIDSAGERIDLSGDWAASDPEMVAITRGHGEVTIVVRKPGESDLFVSTGDGSKVLHVRAKHVDNRMEVAITQ